LIAEDYRIRFPSLDVTFVPLKGDQSSVTFNLKQLQDFAVGCNWAPPVKKSVNQLVARGS